MLKLDVLELDVVMEVSDVLKLDVLELDVVMEV